MLRIKIQETKSLPACRRPPAKAKRAGVGCILVIKNMAIQKILLSAIRKLQRKNIESAILDAEVLLSFALQKSKEFLYSQPEYQLTKAEQHLYQRLIKKRLKYVPVAYLTGEKEFYGLKFLVNKHVLVPRPQSEEIIDKALEIIKKPSKLLDTRYTIQDTRYTICDLGTGSGCLIISLAKKLQQQNILDKFKLYATDVSREALKVAKQNAKLHQVDEQITFLKGNLLKPLIKKFSLNPNNQPVNLIITNLPYLTRNKIKNEPSINQEPVKALKGNYYNKLFKQLEKFNPQTVVIFEDKDGIKIKGPSRLNCLNEKGSRKQGV